MPKLIIFNKPFKVLSQFTDLDKNRTTLKDFISEKDCYPAGRLDYDSEGLLLLTNDGTLQHQLSHPKHKEEKTYLVQVEGEINQAAIEQLKQGPILKDGPCKPCKAECVEPPENLWARNPPVRYRANIPTSWLKITLTEGRNRQVRRMTASVGFPTLRLIRIAIGQHTLEQLQPGEHAVLEVPTPSIVSTKPPSSQKNKQKKHKQNKPSSIKQADKHRSRRPFKQRNKKR